MNIAAIDPPNEAVPPEMDADAQDVRQMTKAQLLRLGVRMVVYLRVGTVNGETAYAIHAADGSPMAVVEDVDAAIEIACEAGMAFVAVH